MPRLSVTILSTGYPNRSEERPFFAFLNFFDAHTPYLLPEGAEPRFGPRVQDPADTALLHNWNNRPKKNVPEKLANLASDSYDNCIAYVDSEIGKLLDELERRCLARQHPDHHHFRPWRTSGRARSLRPRQEPLQPGAPCSPGHHPTRRIGERPDCQSSRQLTRPASHRCRRAWISERFSISGYVARSLLAVERELTIRRRSTAVFSEVALRDTVSRNQSRPPAWRGPMKSIVSDGKSYIRNADGREEIYDVLNDPAELQDLAGRSGFDSLVEQLRDADRVHHHVGLAAKRINAQ